MTNTSPITPTVNNEGDLLYQEVHNGFDSACEEAREEINKFINNEALTLINSIVEYVEKSNTPTTFYSLNIDVSGKTDIVKYDGKLFTTELITELLQLIPQNKKNNLIWLSNNMPIETITASEELKHIIKDANVVLLIDQDLKESLIKHYNL